MKLLVRFATAAALLLGVVRAQDAPKEEPKPTSGISVIKFVAPSYPPIARAARVMGDVRLLVEIEADGTARDVRASRGHLMLDRSSIDTVKQWRFGCQRCNAAMIHIVTIRYVIDESLGPCEKPQLRVQPALPTIVTVRANSLCTETMVFY
jgi:TonB family protein